MTVSDILCVAFLFSSKTSSLQTAPKEKKHLFAFLILLGLLLLEYPAWIGTLTFAVHRGLKGQVETFTREFSSTDLILVDQNATGDGFAMLTGPGQFLYGKQTVYFFNPYDLPALDTSRFDRIYLLTPEESQARYATVFGERLVFKRSVTLTLEHLEDSSLKQSASFHLPEPMTTTTRNLLFQVY